MKIRALPVMIAVVLSMSCAQAAPAPAAVPAKATVTAVAPTPEAQAARAEIDRLVDRIQELSKQLGEGNDVRVIVRKQRHGGPMAHDMDHEGSDGDADARKREIRIERVGPGMDGMHGMHGMHEMKGMKGMHGKDGMRGMHGDDAMFKQGPGLGIVMAPNPAASGVRVAAITPDSPAAKAGLRSGDVVLAVNGKSIGGNGTAAVDSARDLLGDLKQDQVVKLRYAREGKTFDASVKADAIRHVMMYNRGGMPHGDGDVRWFRRGSGPMLPPGVEMEIERIGPRGNCAKGEADCGMPAIYQAFRWQGLNLSSIDADLGRYFGTDKGVLVISAGPDLKGLKSGDVIMRVAGKPVESPRDVMRALREKESGSQLQFDLMRERKAASASVTVPKSRPLPFVAPPPPPPAPRGAAPAAPTAPAAPGAAPQPPRPLGSMDAPSWNQDDAVTVVVLDPAR